MSPLERSPFQYSFLSNKFEIIDKDNIKSPKLQNLNQIVK